MKRIKKKVNVKDNVLPHTQAKLDLFKGYLEHYLRVLSYAGYKQINLFDIYCGAGIYDDGKKGSPLLAIDCVRKINTEIINNKKSLVPISLTVNDFDAQRIENLKNNVNIQDIENLVIEYHNKDANEMLDIVANRVSKYPKDNKNLVFLDPYGYSNINKDKIINLLNNKCTEIILFLPVMQMYRFTEIAFIDEEKPHYENLRKFIISFFNDSDNINTNTIFEYIHSIKEKLSINDTYFTCSHYIEREKGNYYALFFISSSIYGLEKMLETKWKLDPVRGKGFHQTKNSMQLSLFDEEMNETDKSLEISHLENLIYQSIKQNDSITNIDIYKSTLKSEFLPKHANTALKNLLTQNKIQEINNSMGYGINYNNYKNKKIVSKFKIV